MKRFTKKTVKASGRYHFKTETEWFETNDPATIRKVLAQRKPLSFNQRIDQLDQYAKAVLADAGIPPVDQMWCNAAGEWAAEETAESRGGAWICNYVQSVLCHDAGSVIGLAARVVSKIATMRANGPAPSDAFDLGTLSERLLGSQFWDAGRERTRFDKLSELMMQALLVFQDEHGRLPTAKELWGGMEPGEYIQEIEDDTIFWRTKTQPDKKTSFHDFEKRLTRLKKKLQK